MSARGMAYRATYTRPDGTPAVLHLIARSAWAAYAALFDALADGGATQVRMRRLR